MWEKVNIVKNENGTISYNLRKLYMFRDDLSVGSDDDVVIVPNIPMLSATSQSKHAARWVERSPRAMTEQNILRGSMCAFADSCVWPWPASWTSLRLNHSCKFLWVNCCGATKIPCSSWPRMLSPRNRSYPTKSLDSCTARMEHHR